MTNEEFKAVLALDGKRVVVEPSIYFSPASKRKVYAGIQRNGDDYKDFGRHVETEEAAVTFLREWWEEQGMK